MSGRRPFFVAGALALTATLLVTACRAQTDDETLPVEATATTTTVAPTTTMPTTTTTIDPGTLPQTDEKPTASGPQWDKDVAGLWQAIVTDDPAPARDFFFPLTSYRQVKAISNIDGDYQNRLIAYYEQDIHALHAKLGADAPSAVFVGIDINTPNVTWIKPGVEYNKGAYWRVQDNTLRYTVNGQKKSFVVKSMISWRGQWYVVHLTSIR